MAQLSNQDFYDKWVPLLADNVFQDIDGPRLEELLADMRDSFAPLASQSTQPVPPAVNFDPVLRQLTAMHPLGASELEYTHNNGGFTAYAPLQVDNADHAQGEWRFRVAGAQGRNPSQLTDSPQIAVKASIGATGPLSITANQISDAGPAGRALLRAPTTDAQLAMLDYLQLADYPAFVRVYGELGAVKYLLDQVKQLNASVAPAAPSAPTDGQVDDTADTLSGKLVPGYVAVADYEVFGAPGFPGIVNASMAGADVQNGRIYSRGLTGSILIGSAGIRVAASGNRPAGGWLLNEKPFTGSAVIVPPTPTALAVGFTIGSATLTAGQSLSFSATASGGTSPYQHVVHAEDVSTGAATSIGSAGTPGYAGIWAAVPAGTYDLTDTVTDAAGASKVSAVRRVVVSATTTTPATGNSYVENGYLEDGYIE